MRKFSVSIALVVITATVSPLFADTVYVTEKGGYDTTTHVVGTQELFVLTRIQADDLVGWVRLANTAQAFEQLSQWIQQGKVSQRAEVLASVVSVGNTTFSYGKAIEIDDLVTAFAAQYTPQTAFGQLIQAGVLSNQGYLQGVTQNVTVPFAEMDFSFLGPLLETLTFGITDPAAQTELRRELFSLLLAKNRVLQVTQEQTTRYQSRNDNIFNAFVESVVGNTVSAVLSPDRIQVVKQQVGWSPSVYMPSYYPEITVGFNPFPYFGGRRGIIGVNGPRMVSDASVQAGLYNTAPVPLGIKYEQRSILSPYPYREGAQFGLWQIRYDQTSGSGISSTQYGSIGVGVGNVARHLSWESHFGLTYRQASSVGSIGLNWGIHAQFFPFFPFNIYAGYDSRFQNDFSSGTVNWIVQDVQYGLGFNVGPAEVRIGQQFFSYDSTRSSVSGLVATAKYYL